MGNCPSNSNCHRRLEIVFNKPLVIRPLVNRPLVNRPLVNRPLVNRITRYRYRYNTMNVKHILAANNK
jgi:hypothetical protein